MDSCAIRPKILISRCLGFEACRYNAQIIEIGYLKKLTGRVDCLTPCPEKDLGLGVPRPPIRLMDQGAGVRLFQPATGRDLTEAMDRHLDGLLAGAGELDGFVLKSRSPTCGYCDVKIYSGPEKAPALTGRAAGFLGGRALAEKGGAVIDESRLTNLRLREHFLTRIWANARFRLARAAGTMKALIDFQADNKLLLLTYSQSAMRLMGRLTANSKDRPAEELFTEYRALLDQALAKAPRYTSVVNTLEHAFGYFSKELGGAEKRLFVSLLEEYRAERAPLSAPLAVLNSWRARFSRPYLDRQTFFDPFPAELIEKADSGIKKQL